MTFNDYKAYRRTMQPILEQRKLLHGNTPDEDIPKMRNIKALVVCAIVGLVMWMLIFMISGCNHQPPTVIYG